MTAKGVDGVGPFFFGFALTWKKKKMVKSGPLLERKLLNSIAENPLLFAILISFSGYCN